MAYDDITGNLDVLPAGGGIATTIQHNDVGFGSSWLPNAASLVYCSSNGSYSNIYMTSSGGGTATDMVPVGYQNSGGFYFPNASSDGQSITASWEANGAGNEQIVIFSQSGAFIQIPQVANGIDYRSSFSPDGSEVAFYRTNSGGASPGIYVANYAGTSVNQVVADTANEGYVTGLSWSPFPSAEYLIGGTHFYTSVATGFLLAENGPQFGSLTAFSTTTPSTASATTSATNGSQPLVYTLSGDQITKIGYSNYYLVIIPSL